MPSSRCLHLSRIVHSLQPSSGSPSKGLWISHSLLAPHPPLPFPPLLEVHLQDQLSQLSLPPLQHLPLLINREGAIGGWMWVLS